MSGPKSATYVVLSNGELRRRAVEAARKDAEELARRVRALWRELDSTGEQVALSVAEIDLDLSTRAEIQEWIVATTDTVIHAENALAARRSAAQAERMVASIAGPRADSLQKRPSSVGATDPRTAANANNSWRERVAARVESALASATSLNEADRAEVEGAARAALSARTEASAALLTDELRLRVHQRTEAAEARRRATVEATRLLATLHGLDGPDVASARDELHDVQKGTADLTLALRARTEAVAVVARREADRRYTAHVLAGALADLGYEVEEGFATLIAGQRDGHAARWAAHAVRVRFAGPNELSVRVVRESCDDPSDDQLREDKEVEHEFCRDFARVAARLEARHVQMRITSQVMPGEQPVETVERLRARRLADTQQAIARAIPQRPRRP